MQSGGGGDQEIEGDNDDITGGAATASSAIADARANVHSDGGNADIHPNARVDTSGGAGAMDEGWTIDPRDVVDGGAKVRGRRQRPAACRAPLEAWVLTAELATGAYFPGLFHAGPRPPAMYADVRGGLFADDPGLGKTVTALALVLRSRGLLPAPPAGAGEVTWGTPPSYNVPAPAGSASDLERWWARTPTAATDETEAMDIEAAEAARRGARVVARDAGVAAAAIVAVEAAGGVGTGGKQMCQTTQVTVNGGKQMCQTTQVTVNTTADMMDVDAVQDAGDGSTIVTMPHKDATTQDAADTTWHTRFGSSREGAGDGGSTATDSPCNPVMPSQPTSLSTPHHPSPATISTPALVSAPSLVSAPPLLSVSSLVSEPSLVSASVLVSAPAQVSAPMVEDGDPSTSQWNLCDDCGKWRRMLPGAILPGEGLFWYCQQNPVGHLTK